MKVGIARHRQGSLTLASESVSLDGEEGLLVTSLLLLLLLLLVGERIVSVCDAGLLPHQTRTLLTKSVRNNCRQAQWRAFIRNHAPQLSEVSERVYSIVASGEQSRQVRVHLVSLRRAPLWRSRLCLRRRRECLRGSREVGG